MKLTQVRLERFRRFETASIDLDAPVVTIVGPNEAGKSTLLHAMTLLESDEPVEIGDLTDYGSLEPGETVVTATYLLDTDERALAREAGSTTEPTWMIKSKRVDGKVATGFRPPLERGTEVRSRAYQHVVDTLKKAEFNEFLENAVEIPDKKNPNKKVKRPLRGFMEAAETVLASDANSLPKVQLNTLQDAIKHLRHVAGQDDQPNPSVIDSLVEAYDFERATPTSRLAQRLEDTRPRMLLFSDADREFRNEYSVKAINADRPELANILALGGSSIEELRAAMRSPDSAGRRGLEQQVNKQLQREVRDAWGQADTWPDLAIYDENVRLYVKSATPRGSSKISERSDGFRFFLAMLSFIRSQRESVPPVLLLDEAERHLHYDAQADLVTMFYKQDIAAKVVYTTHSAGCLPHDLGAVRGVKPDEVGRSEVVNGFWSEGPGYTPLFLLMGASTLAFSPMRRSLLVFGEGASELILLPALFAEVAPGERLSFQVAPGLSELKYDELHKLEDEAAQTCFLVDGDGEGQTMASKLRSQGISEDRILTLPEDTEIEDLVRPDLLLAAVNEELRRSGHGVDVEPDSFRQTPRWAAVKEACKTVGVSEPSKNRVARRIVELHREQYAEEEATKIIDPNRQDAVRSIHEAIVASFEAK